MSQPPEIGCSRCAELRGRCVRVNEIKIGSRITCYECPSCDYVIPLEQFQRFESHRGKDK